MTHSQMNTLLANALVGVVTLSATLYVGPAAAQAYPTKPVTIIVSYPPGGDTDALARVFADKLTPRLGQSVVRRKPLGCERHDR